jgi:hypothetical protein
MLDFTRVQGRIEGGRNREGSVIAFSDEEAA